MTTRLLLMTLIVALTAMVPGVSQAQELTPAEAQEIARDAYIYGFPIVESYKTMYGCSIDQGSGEYKAPLNTLKHEANVFSPDDTSVVTPKY